MPIDITERLEMLGATLDLLDEGVAVLDSYSRVIYWNTAAATLTGHLRMNLLSRPFPPDLYKVNEDHRCVGDACDCGAPPSSVDKSASESLLP